MKKYSVAIYINGIFYKSYNWTKKQIRNLIQVAQWGNVKYEFQTLYKNKKRIFVEYEFAEALYMDSAIRHINKKQFHYVSKEYLEGYCNLWANTLKTFIEECLPETEE